MKRLATGEEVSLTQIGTSSMCGSINALEAVEDSSSPVSPPPFMAGMVEIELDKETGHVEILDYVAVVDCGTVINPNLATSSGGGRSWYRESVWHCMRIFSTTRKGQLQKQFLYAV